jgi:hypothetical protein
MRSWHGVLRNVDLAAAKEASHKMHAGEIDEPKGFDRHPAAIRNACGVGRSRDADKPRYDVDGNQTFACLTCMDTGAVLCWHPYTVQSVARSGQCVMPMYTCVFPCTCHAGDARERAFGKTPRFDAKRAFPIGAGGVNSAEEQAGLLEWLRTREPVRPENYEPAFDAPVSSGGQTEMEW